ncbi:MAG: hypothetical protein WDN45_03605 [Caulobacteraceae bacterium]
MPTEAVREPEESTAQRLGFLIFAAAILFSTVAASQLAFSHDWVKDTAIVLFAVAIRLVIVGAEGVLRRLGRCAVLAATIWLAFSAAGWAMLMDLRNDEGGPARRPADVRRLSGASGVRPGERAQPGGPAERPPSVHGIRPLSVTPRSSIPQT